MGRKTLQETTRRIVRGTSLDALFDEWEVSYPPIARLGFQRDGIVSETEFARQRDRVLFIMLEPNSRNGNYNRFYGWDLRHVIPLEVPRKPNSLNLARWARLLLDGTGEPGALSVDDTRALLARIAYMNLKKLGGSGTADVVNIAVQAWHDREFIRREIQTIQPTIVVACGDDANRLLGKVLHDDRLWTAPTAPVWRWQEIPVVAGNHPSVRPVHTRAALERLHERARDAGIGAFRH